jgi:adenylate cyclase
MSLRRPEAPRWLKPLQTSLGLSVLAIYLFVSAPPPLSSAASGGTMVPVAQALRVVARENEAIRALYTQRIVGDGKRVGLAFDEAWQRPEVEAGPLPALLLRMMAEQLQRGDGALGLFLGSAYPIVSANRFSPQQSDAFRQVSATREPHVMYAADIGRYVAMFPDVATVTGCVECHNEHPHSPKRDWKVGDVMGATTWMYPHKELTTRETLRLVAQVRSAARASYARYLEKVRTFSSPTEIGTRWPSEGRYLPDVASFMLEIEQRTAAQTLRSILTLEVDDGA